MFQPNTDTAGRRYEQPLIVNPVQTSGVMGVWLHEGEDVDWHITTNMDGTQHCHGYTIRKKGETIHESALQIGTLDPELIQLSSGIS